MTPFFRSLARKTLVGVVLCLLLLTATSGIALSNDPDLFGSWNTELGLYPSATGNDLLDYDSVLTVNLSVGGIGLESRTHLSDRYTTKYAGDSIDGLYSQSFSSDFRLGVFDVYSDLVFAPYDQRLDYWLTESSLTFAGLTLSTTFLLEYAVAPPFIDFPAEYGAGLEFSASGETPGGTAIGIDTYLGMEPNPAEEIGLERGSGYDIYIDLDQEEEEILGRLPRLDYVTTIISVDEVPITENCSFDAETKLSSEKGFEYTRFNFLLEAQDLPITIDADLEFRTQTKSVTIYPEVELAWEDFTVFTRLAEIDEDSVSYGLQFTGFGLDPVDLGPVSLSSRSALVGNLYADLGTREITQRAHNYTVAPRDPFFYRETGYNQVLSLQSGGEAGPADHSYNYGFDFYFNMGAGPDSFFDFGLFTADTTYALSEQLEVGAGLSVGPNVGPSVMMKLDLFF